MQLGQSLAGLGGGRAAVGVLVEELQDQLLVLAGDTGAQGGQGSRGAVEVLVENLPARSGEGGGSGQEFVEQAAQGVQVTRRGEVRVAAGLLGGHVGGGADGGAGDGQGVVGCLGESGDAEVAQPGAAVLVDEMLDGLMSRWTIPARWAASRAWLIWVA